MKCPHGCEIKIERKFGIIIYKHKHNEETCSLMSDFNISLTKIEKCLVQNVGKLDLTMSDPIVITLCDSRPVANFFIEKFSKMELKEIITVVYYLYLNRVHELLIAINGLIGERFWNLVAGVMKLSIPNFYKITNKNIQLRHKDLYSKLAEIYVDGEKLVKFTEELKNNYSNIETLLKLKQIVECLDKKYQ